MAPKTPKTAIAPAAPSAARTAMEVLAARLKKGPCREEDIRGLAHVELTIAVKAQLAALLRTGAVERRGDLLYLTKKGAAFFAGAAREPAKAGPGARAYATKEGRSGLQARIWRALRMRKAAELHDLVAGAFDATTRPRFGKLVFRAKTYLEFLEAAGVVAFDRTRRAPGRSGRKDRPGWKRPEVRLLRDLGPVHPYRRGAHLCDPNSGFLLARQTARGGAR